MHTADVGVSNVRSAASRRGSVKMMAKNVRLSEKSRQKLVEGINIVANAVKVTLGPKVRETMTIYCCESTLDVSVAPGLAKV